MSEGGEKSEEPTPKKERDAREKGQVAKSQEVVITTTLFGLIAYVWSTSDTLIARMSAGFELRPYRDGGFPQAAMAAMEQTFDMLVIVLLPMLGLVIFLAVASNVGQFGFLMSGDSIMPKLEKISPMAGFKRIFSVKHLVETLKNIVKIVFLSILLAIALRENFSDLMQAVHCGLGCVRGLAASMLGEIFRFSALAFIIIAGADFVYQRKSHTKSLMMSKDEVKREYKESEGDPHIKGKRKQLAQEFASGDGGVVKNSSAVVVNPTHYAVAIVYDRDSIPLPVVTAKGAEHAAAWIRGEAEAQGVPIFRSPALARRLFVDAAVDEPVPVEFFDALAEILVWIEHNRASLYGGRPLNHGVIDIETKYDRLYDRRPTP